MSAALIARAALPPPLPPSSVPRLRWVHAAL